MLGGRNVAQVGSGPPQIMSVRSMEAVEVVVEPAVAGLRDREVLGGHRYDAYAYTP